MSCDSGDINQLTGTPSQYLLISPQKILRATLFAWRFMRDASDVPPSIRLHYSNQAECLLDALALNIRETRTRLTNPLSPLIVAVPNTNVAQWLSYGLSERLGISANIDFIFLEKVFRRLIAQVLPNTSVLNKTTVEAALVLFFQTEPWLRNPELQPIGKYIHSAEHSQFNPVIRSARVFSLASQLAQAFDDYSLSRQEMIAAWKQNDLVIDKSHRLAPMEKWQRALFRELFQPQGFFQQSDLGETKRYGFLSELFAECAQTAASKGIHLPSELNLQHNVLHFFGFSYVATGYIRMFAALSKFFEVNFYALNPCAEYWEDTKTLFEEHRETRKNRPKKNVAAIEQHLWEGDSDDLLNLENGCLGDAITKENLALRLWGKPGREYMRALQSLTQCEFQDHFKDPTATHQSLLAHLQRCILLRSPKPENTNANFAKDESITYFNCQGGLKRELEAVASEIWRLVNSSSKTDNPLRFHEIAIILPASKKENYEGLIHTVFHESHKLPLRIIDSTARATNQLVDAFARFLELPFSDNTRGPLLRFLTSPAILERHGGTAEQRIKAAAAAHIFVGSNATDLKNTYIESDAFNWDQGLFRLSLGTLMPGLSQDAQNLFTHENTMQSYAVEDSIPATEVQSFVVLARSALADLEFVRTNTLPLDTWLSFFRNALLAYLPEHSSESDEDSIIRNQIHGVITELQDLAPRSNIAIDGATASRFLLGRVQKMTTGENGLGLDGVMVASFLPMRPIPLKVLFVLGMGEGHFPSTDKHSPLDLRSARRRVADVTPREQDKYMFLETLLSVREKLYISWIGRDQTDNEPLEPSGLVHELNQTLVEMGANPLDVKCAVQIPLRRWKDSISFPSIPEVAKERACAAAHEKLAEELNNSAYLEKHLILKRICENTKKSLGISTLQTQNSENNPHQLHTLSLRTLGKFLRNPMLAYAEDKLHLRIDDYEEEVDVFEEPTGIDSLLRMNMVRDSVCEALLTLPKSLSECKSLAIEKFKNMQHELLSRGDFPTGILGEREAESALSLIDTICDQLYELRNGNKNSWESANAYSFGEDTLGSRAVFLNPLTVAFTNKPVSAACRIVGNVSLLQQSSETAQLVVFSMRGEKTIKKDPLPEFALGMLQLCALRIALPTKAFPSQITISVSVLREAKILSRVCVVPSPQDCENHLSAISSEYFSGAHAMYLPSKSIAHLGNVPECSRWENIQETLTNDWLEEQEAEPDTQSSSANTIPNITTYPPPPNSAELYGRRFNFLFNHLVPEEKKK